MTEPVDPHRWPAPRTRSSPAPAFAGAVQANAHRRAKVSSAEIGPEGREEPRARKPGADTEPSAARDFAWAEVKAIATHIAQVQLANGAIPWEHRRGLDPWDHIEAAMGLAVGGRFDAAARAYRFLASRLTAHGGWWSAYDRTLAPASEHLETHHAAYLATGLWHRHLLHPEAELLRALWPTLRRSIDFVCQHQAPGGEIYWAVNARGEPHRDALRAGCASIYTSLGCAIAIADTIDAPSGRWHHWVRARERLEQALRSGSGFDRTWPSKQRFAMDWYYPVLCGALGREGGRERLDTHWTRFVDAAHGCRCVEERPWFTAAETAELAMALARVGRRARASELLDAVACLRAADGGYWTGQVLPERMLWPNERTTWTGAALALALDSCHRLTPGASWFVHRGDPD